MKKKEKKKKNSSVLPYIVEYKNYVGEEITKICESLLKIIDENLLKKAEDDEAKLFYIKMKGDLNSDMVEYVEDELKKKLIYNTIKAYEEANEIANKLPGLNPIVLRLAHNFSRFYAEVIDERKKAIKIAKLAIEKAYKEFQNMDDEDSCCEPCKPYTSILNFLSLDLDIWEKEEEGGQKAHK